MGLSWEGSRDMVRFLLVAGADVSALDHAGRNAKRLAEELGHTDLLPLPEPR